MIKRFATLPNGTCPDLAAFKLPPCSLSQEDDIETMAKEALKNRWPHLYLFGHPQKPYPTYYENDLNNVMIGICKAREKYEFNRQDVEIALKAMEIALKPMDNDLASTILRLKSLKELQFGIIKQLLIPNTPLIPIAFEVEYELDEFPLMNSDGTVKGVWVYE